MTVIDTSTSPVFYIKQGDLLPTLRAEHLYDNTGTIVDLSSGVTAVYFNLSDRDGTSIIEHGAVRVIDAPTSEVEYLWVPGDTDREPATYLGEFEVLYASGKPARFPNYANIQVILSGKQG